MLYFDHSIETRNDEKIKAIISEFGITGYGVWCALLEEVASAQKNFYILFIDDNFLKTFSISLNIRPAKLEKVLQKFADLELIRPDFYRENIIFVSNFVRKHAKYFEKLQRNNTFSQKSCTERVQMCFKIRKPKPEFTMTCEDFIRNVNGIMSDLIPNRIEKNRIEKKRINDYIPPVEKSEISESDETGIPENPETPEPDIVIPEAVEPEPEPEPVPVPDPEPEPPKPKRQFRLFSVADDEYHLANTFAAEIRKSDKGAIINVQHWANDIFYLSNGRDRSEIEKVLQFGLSDSFWSDKIVNPEALFKHYTKLVKKMEKKENANDNNTEASGESDYDYFLKRELERDRRNGVVSVSP